jgi:hypothetical protein
MMAVDLTYPAALRAYLRKRKEFDRKDLFLKDFFKTLFGEYS